MEVQVGCTSVFLNAFRTELVVRANISADVVSNLTCTPASGVGRRRLFIFVPSGEKAEEVAEPVSGSSGGHQTSDGAVASASAVTAGAAMGGRALLAATAAGGSNGSGTASCSGQPSLSLLVFLNVPIDSPHNSSWYKARLQAALDSWTAESQSGGGVPGALALCGPSSDQITTTTNVHVVTQIPLSDVGASSLASVCGSSAPTTTTALGGEGSSVACRLGAGASPDGKTAGVSPSPTASSPDAVQPPATAVPSVLPIVIAGGVVGGVCVCMAFLVFAVVARRRKRQRKEEERNKAAAAPWADGGGGNQFAAAFGGDPSMHGPVGGQQRASTGMLTLVLPSASGAVAVAPLRRNSFGSVTEARLKRALAASGVGGAPLGSPAAVLLAEHTSSEPSSPHTAAGGSRNSGSLADKRGSLPFAGWLAPRVRPSVSELGVERTISSSLPAAAAGGAGAVTSPGSVRGRVSMHNNPVWVSDVELGAEGAAGDAATASGAYARSNSRFGRQRGLLRSCDGSMHDAQPPLRSGVGVGVGTAPNSPRSVSTRQITALLTSVTQRPFGRSSTNVEHMSPDGGAGLDEGPRASGGMGPSSPLPVRAPPMHSHSGDSGGLPHSPPDRFSQTGLGLPLPPPTAALAALSAPRLNSPLRPQPPPPPPVSSTRSRAVFAASAGNEPGPVSPLAPPPRAALSMASASPPARPLMRREIRKVKTMAAQAAMSDAELDVLDSEQLDDGGRGTAAAGGGAAAAAARVGSRPSPPRRATHSGILGRTASEPAGGAAAEAQPLETRRKKRKSKGGSAAQPAWAALSMEDGGAEGAAAAAAPPAPPPQPAVVPGGRSGPRRLGRSPLGATSLTLQQPDV